MRRVRAGVWAAATVCLVVAGLWFASGSGAVADVATAKPAPVAVPRETARRTAPLAAASANGALPSAHLAEADDCRLPSVPPTPGETIAASPAFDKAIDDVRRETTARLSRGADPARHSAGLLLERRREQLAATPGCADETTCSVASAAPGPAVERLAALARETDSATAYALALHACGGWTTRSATSSFCATLSNERWAQLAPQSVWPWLGLASEAQRRGDASGVEYAMNHAAQATDWRAVGAGVAALVIDELPVDLPPATRLAMAGEALSLQYSLFGALQGLVNHCPADAEPGRRQTCLRLAERMLDRTDDLIGMKIAIRLGERSGVPEARLARRRDELQALTRAGPMEPLLAAVGPAGFGCAQLSRVAVALERQARIGELAALRERSAESAERNGSR